MAYKKGSPKKQPNICNFKRIFDKLEKKIHTKLIYAFKKHICQL